jgi:hypothetical protein
MNKAIVNAEIKNYQNGELTIELKLPMLRSMLEGEEVIQQGLNAVGILASGKLLENFDTDGSPIGIGDIKLTSKGKVLKEYETPYGKAVVKRHVYQSSKGGATFCPLDNDARIIGSSTPKFAKMVTHKYTRNSVDEVKTDLESNHGRSICRAQIQKTAEIVGAISMAKEETWSYSLPDINKEIQAISIGMDGAMMLMCDDGYRQAMIGTIALYDAEGNREYSLYVGAAPEYGKGKFIEKMKREINNVKRAYPSAKYIGIADGAKDNWKFLEKQTEIQITDFYHATEYLTDVSESIFDKKHEKERIGWLSEHCHNLKHKDGAAFVQLEEFKKIKKEKKLTESKLQKLDGAITYFTNQGLRMNYAKFRKKNYPIGSGVTEAACKTILKQRLCCSGMKWRDKGASIVLSLRCLEKSLRWDDFWNKINQYGASLAF